MLGKIIAFLVVVGTLFSFYTGTTSTVATTILEESSAAIALVTTLAGGLCFWSGLMEIAKRTQLTEKFCKLISPLIRFLFPSLKPDGEAAQFVGMNMVSNLLGLGNAATPFGIKAIRAMKTEQRSGKTATNAMVVFVVLNTASFQLIPTSVAMIRTRYGSADPFGVIPAVWLATAVSLFCGLSAAFLFSKRGNKGD